MVEMNVMDFLRGLFAKAKYQSSIDGRDRSFQAHHLAAILEVIVANKKPLALSLLKEAGAQIIEYQGYAAIDVEINPGDTVIIIRKS